MNHKKNTSLSDEIGWLIAAHEDYINSGSLMTYHILLGHPSRPTIFLVKTSEPSVCRNDKEWDLICYSANYLVWWEDSKEKVFNEEAKKALVEIKAEEVTQDNVGDDIVTLYKMKKPVRAGILNPDKIVYDAFNKADENAFSLLSSKPVGDEIIWMNTQ